MRKRLLLFACFGGTNERELDHQSTFADVFVRRVTNWENTPNNLPTEVRKAFSQEELEEMLITVEDGVNVTVFLTHDTLGRYAKILADEHPHVRFIVASSLPLPKGEVIFASQMALSAAFVDFLL